MLMEGNVAQHLWSHLEHSDGAKAYDPENDARAGVGHILRLLAGFGLRRHLTKPVVNVAVGGESWPADLVVGTDVWQLGGWCRARGGGVAAARRRGGSGAAAAGWRDQWAWREG